MRLLTIFGAHVKFTVKWCSVWTQALRDVKFAVYLGRV